MQAVEIGIIGWMVIEVKLPLDKSKLLTNSQYRFLKSQNLLHLVKYFLAEAD